MASCSIVAVGNELTRGKIIDSNSAYIAAVLHALGTLNSRIAQVEDNVDTIRQTLLQQAETSDVLITTGGLGPTADDLTRNAVAAAAGVELVLDTKSLNKLEEFCRRRNRTVNENNRRQVFFPAGATVMSNRLGTADAFITLLRLSGGRVVPVVSLPGVPKEMKALLAEQICPWLLQHYSDLAPPLIEQFRVFGLAESVIGELIEQVGLSSEVEVSYRPQFPEILIQLTVRPTLPDARIALTNAADRVIAALGPEQVISRSLGGPPVGGPVGGPVEGPVEGPVGGPVDSSIQHVVHELLLAQRVTLAAAESCSGGRFADALISLPGSSQYFLASIVSYSNQAKQSLLGVSAELLATHGAVSEEVALAMADGARNVTGADLAISITGIAGPDGGTAEKPVGLIWLGFSSASVRQAFRLNLPWDREYNREYSAKRALDIIRRHLLGLRLE